jgi:NADPH-dependent curcumin reductase CurA
MPTKSRQVHLAKRPDGLPKPDDFKIVDTVLPDIADGQVLVKQLFMSVDPYMRPRLSNDFELDQVMPGGALGRVVQSRNGGFAEGDIVSNLHGFREYAVSNGLDLKKLAPQAGVPLSAYMSVLGATGFIAYGGLLEIAKLMDGEQVFVSTAAGAVGSIAAQIAKLKHCYVIGSTGSDEKGAWLREIGLDAVINYKKMPIQDALKAAAPRGIDVYFDNVGGDHLDAALACMNPLGRVAVCGMISGYNEPGTRTAVRNLSNIIYGRINLRGFVAMDFVHLREQFTRDMSDWLKSGKLKWKDTVLNGIEQAPHAMVGLMRGENTGKMLVKLSE